jgi:hypothetical protein
MTNRKSRQPREETPVSPERQQDVRSTVPVHTSRSPFQSKTLAHVVGDLAVNAIAKAPVPTEVLKGLNLRVGPVKGKTGTLGTYSAAPDKHEISLSNKIVLPKVEQVVTHELGHHLAHPALWGRQLQPRAAALGEALADNYANQVLGPLPFSGYEAAVMRGQPLEGTPLGTKEAMDVYRAHRRYGSLSDSQFTDVSQGPLAEKNRKVRRLRP